MPLGSVSPCPFISVSMSPRLSLLLSFLGSLSSLSMGGAITQGLPLRCVGQVLCPPLGVQVHTACLTPPLHLLPAPPFLQEPRSMTSHEGGRAVRWLQGSADVPRGLLPVGTSLSSSDSGWSFPDAFSFLGFPDVDADAHPLSDSIMSAGEIRAVMAVNNAASTGDPGPLLPRTPPPHNGGCPLRG